MFIRSRKFIGVLVIAMLVALLLAACGDNTATSGTSTGPTAAGTTAAAPTTTAATATTSAAATTAATATTTTAATTAAVATTTTSAPTTVAATTSVAATTVVGGTTTAPTGTTVAGSTAVAGGTTTTAAGSTSKTIACTAPSAASTSGKKYRIGIAVQNTIPALQDAINGTKKGMEQCGFVEGKNVEYSVGNALGDIPALATIGRKFADDKVDLIVAVGSAALSNMYTTNKDAGTPIIFNSVTDPYSVVPSVIKTATDHGPLTGVQTFPPVEDGLKAIQASIPNAKNITILYNPTEVNAVATLKKAQEVAPKYGMTIVATTVQNSGEVLQAANAVVDKTDVFLSVTDVTVVNGLEALVKVSIDNKKPLFSLDPASAPRGAAVAIGFDYFDNGVTSASYVAQLLEGKKPQDLEIKVQPRGPTAVNLKAAEGMGFKIPDAILSVATVKYSEITPKK